MLITAVKCMSWFYCPSSACKKSVCICSTKLFPALTTYYIFLKFMYGNLSRTRQTAKLWCLWSHYSNAEDKFRGRLCTLKLSLPIHFIYKTSSETVHKLRADNWAVSGYHSKCVLQSKWHGSEEGLIKSIMFTCWNTLIDFHSIIRWGLPTTFPREQRREVGFPLEVEQCWPARRARQAQKSWCLVMTHTLSGFSREEALASV